jgi:hypothetical protein
MSVVLSSRAVTPVDLLGLEPQPRGDRLPGWRLPGAGVIASGVV